MTLFLINTSLAKQPLRQMILQGESNQCPTLRLFTPFVSLMSHALRASTHSAT